MLLDASMLAGWGGDGDSHTVVHCTLDLSRKSTFLGGRRCITTWPWRAAKKKREGQEKTSEEREQGVGNAKRLPFRPFYTKFGTYLRKKKNRYIKGCPHSRETAQGLPIPPVILTEPSWGHPLLLDQIYRQIHALHGRTL
jgi:hypothetical protein